MYLIHWECVNKTFVVVLLHIILVMFFAQYIMYNDVYLQDTLLNSQRIILFKSSLMIGHKALENSSGTPSLHGTILDTIVSTTVCNSTMVIFFMRLSFISMLKVTWRPTKTIGDLLTNIQLFIKVKANPLRSFVLVKALSCLSLSANDRPYIFFN